MTQDGDKGAKSHARKGGGSHASVAILHFYHTHACTQQQTYPIDVENPRGTARRRRTGKETAGRRRRPATALRTRVASRRRASAWISRAPCSARRAPKTMASSGYSDPTGETEHRLRQAPPPSAKVIVSWPRRGAAQRLRDAEPHRATAVYPHRTGEHGESAATPLSVLLHPDIRYAALVLVEKPCQGQRCLEARQLPGRLRSQEVREGAKTRRKRMRNGDGERRGWRELGTTLKGDGVYEGTRLGVGAPKSYGRDLPMREGRLWWSIGRRAPQQRRVTAPLFWESGTCFFPLHRRRAFNCTPARSSSSASTASQAR